MSQHGNYKPVSADEMTISNKVLFTLSLREGMGLGHACMVSGNDPETICRYLKDVESFRIECHKAVSAANMDLLKASSELMELGRYDKAEEVRKKAEKVHKLVEWQEYGTSEDIEKNLLVAAMECDNSKDIAIGFGMGYRPFIEYMNENPELLEIVEKYKKVLNGN